MFGTVHHPVMSTLYHYLLERGRRRIVFLPNEVFPGQPGFYQQLSGDGQNGRFLLNDGSRVDWEDVVSTALDGYYVQPEGLDNYAPVDQEYLQTESWAALIALFEALGQRALVANHPLKRDTFHSRLATLAHLAQHGLPVPPVCVTSSPERTLAFAEAHPQGVLYRPILGKDLPFQPWDGPAQERLQRVQICPVHFEALVEGPASQVIRVGDEWMTQGSPVPESLLDRLQAAMDDLHLHLAEATFFQAQSGWTCMDLKPFVGPGLFATPESADLLATFFEEGRGR